MYNTDNNSQKEEIFYKILKERVCLLEDKILQRTAPKTREIKTRKEKGIALPDK